MIASVLTGSGLPDGPAYVASSGRLYGILIHIDNHDISRDDFAKAVSVVKDAVTAMVAARRGRADGIEMNTASPLSGISTISASITPSSK